MEDMELQARLSPYIEHLAKTQWLAMILSETVFRGEQVTKISKHLGAMRVLNSPIHDYVEVVMKHEQLVYGILITYQKGKDEILFDFEVEDANLKVRNVEEKMIRYSCDLSQRSKRVVVIMIILNTPHIQGRIQIHENHNHQIDFIQIDLPWLTSHQQLENRLIDKLVHHFSEMLI